jgi:outer membrane protein TolC
VSSLTRPEGNGGWTAERRQQEAEHVRATRFAPVADEERIQSNAWDLTSALRHARRYNRRLAEADESVQVERQRVFDARGRLLPSTTGSGRYTRYTDSQKISRDIQIPGGGTFPPLEIREKEAGTLNGTLTLPLDITGELRHTLAAAQAGYRGEAARRWATQLAEDVEVIRSYFRRLQAERLREVTEQTLAARRAQLAQAQSRFDNGRLTKNQLLVVQVAVRNAEQELVQRDLALDRARWAFNQVVGLDVDAPVALADVRDRPDVPEIDEALATARATNPLLVSVFEEQQRLEETLTALQRSRFPRFSAGASIDYTTSDVLEPQEMGAGFVGFTWDLGTDTRREAQIAAARHAAEQNRVRAERQVRELEESVRGSQRAVSERLSALDAAAVAVGQAEENLRIRQQQFDAGRATSEDVLDAESLLAAERATVATALYEALTRRAELQQLIGEPVEALAGGGS